MKLFFKVVMQCDVTRIICISNKLEYLYKEQSKKILPKQLGYIVILSDLCNAIKKILAKILYHRHFKTNQLVVALNLGMSYVPVKNA